MKDLNLRRQSRGIYSPLPLAARATRLVDLAIRMSAKVALLARGKDFVIEILKSPEGQTPMPVWARAKNDLYSSQGVKNGRMLDRAETQSNQETASA